MKLKLLILAPALVSASPAPQQCSAPVAVPVTVTAAHSTYYFDGEPPLRFSHVPKKPVLVSFGQKAIEQMCGKPPCGMELEGCSADNEIALPDPFKTSDAEFARIARHELAHVNGWPATHGA